MFTSQEALDAQGTEDAILLEWDRAVQIIKEHDGTTVEQFIADQYEGTSPPQVDAGDLFAWLGY